MARVSLGLGGHCSVCGKVPSLGFLYECRQDCDFGSPYLGVLPDRLYGSPDFKSPLRAELEEIGLSESVIAAAEKGDYTTAQLEHLKNLKLKLNQDVANIAEACKTTYTVNKFADTDGASISAFTQESFQCDFRACHTCRPFFLLRAYTSFDAVFADELKPITPDETAALPTKSANIIRGIEFRPPSRSLPPLPSYPPSPVFSYTIHECCGMPHDRAPSESSDALTFRTTQSDVDDINSARRHHRRFYSLGHRSSVELARDISRLPLFSRQGLKMAFQGIFRSSRSSSSSGSNITLPMPRTGTIRQREDETPVGEFDMSALRRVQRHQELNELRYARYHHARYRAACDERTHRHMSDTQLRTRNDSDHGIESRSSSEFTVYSCPSAGDEVEVEGGVALTEEAVEMHTPDILTQPLPPRDSAPSIKDEPVGVEKDDMAVESIMAQV